MSWIVILTTCSALILTPAGTQKWTGCETAEGRTFATQNECAAYVAATFNHWNEKRECKSLGH